MNILKQAYDIAYNRTEEQDRQYGDFQQSMKKSAEIASLITNKDYNAEDIYIAIIAMKLARESVAHKEDNLLDLVAYISRYNDLKNNELNSENTKM